AILLQIDYIKEKMSNSDGLYSCIKNIEIAATNINNFISDLLTFAKELKLMREVISVDELIQSLQSKINIFLRIGGMVSIKFERKENFMLCCDRKYLEQAIFNLIKNAVEAIPAQGEVNVLFLKMGDSCYIEVKDTGKGISSQIKDLLFTPFITTKKNGVGLGLAFTKKIVDAHQGTIEIGYTGEAGTSFQIKIPLNVREDRSLSVEQK
ncbi:MAG: sensor histidine kinase, partial [Planctomycetota bacterium]